MRAERRFQVLSLIAAAALPFLGCGGSPVSALNDDGSESKGVTACGASTGPATCECTPTGRPNEVHQDLACLCSGDAAAEGCCDTLRTYDTAHKCGTALRVLRVKGCGRVSYEASWGYTSETETFDEASGALLGIARASDTSEGACSAHLYEYGDTNRDCATVERCAVCGTQGVGGIPACP